MFLVLGPRRQILFIRFTAAAAGTTLLLLATGFTNEFEALRIVAAASLSMLGFLAFFLGNPQYGLFFLSMGILFQPFLSFHFPRHIWTLIDIAVLGLVYYYAYWATDPYVKGARFEKYIASCFPEPDFVIVDRTRDISKFLDRRVESDSNPDFVFRDTKTGNMFAVECKWRGKWGHDTHGDKGIWWGAHLERRYTSYGKDNNIPVYIAFGIEGTPDTPNEVYLIESQRLHYTFLKQSLIRSGRKL